MNMTVKDDDDLQMFGGTNAENNAGGDLKHIIGNDDDSEEEHEGMIGAGAADGATENVLDTGIIIDSEYIEEIVVTKKDKKVEDFIRKRSIDFKEQEMREYMRKIIKMTESDKKNKDKIKVHMMDIRDSMEYLQQEQMTEQKFWGLLSLNDEEVFDYGRDILKEGTYESQLKLPYT